MRLSGPTVLDTTERTRRRVRCCFPAQSIDEPRSGLSRAGGSYTALARARRRDLEDVLAAVAAGKTPRLRETKAIGCAIENLQ